MRPLCPQRARLRRGFTPAAAVCLSAAVSPSGCFGRKEGGKEGDRMSVHPVFPKNCVLRMKEGKKGGFGQCLKIQISQSEEEDEAGRKMQDWGKTRGSGNHHIEETLVKRPI